MTAGQPVEPHILRIGFLVNPLAGIGGSLALKGSDGEAVRDIACQTLAQAGSRAAERAARALACLAGSEARVHFTCWPGIMGADILAATALPCTVIGELAPGLPDAADTRRAAAALRASGIDILLFAGGDGTARDVFDALGADFPVLGIPAGVKMHSGVFAVSPEAAGELLLSLATAGLVDLSLQEVRDIDEEAFRQDRVRTRFYGEMLVPREGRYMQHTKVAGVESEELVAADIAAWVVERMDDETLYLIGPGSTTAAIMAELQLPNTLLGVDVVKAGQVLCADASEADILACLEQHGGAPVALYITVIGGQGHVFGRGNQQLSAAVLRRIGPESIHIIAAKSKITALGGRPLLVDTNDPALDRTLSGYRSIITGYEDRILYPLGNPDTAAPL